MIGCDWKQMEPHREHWDRLGRLEILGSLGLIGYDWKHRELSQGIGILGGPGLIGYDCKHGQLTQRTLGQTGKT